MAFDTDFCIITSFISYGDEEEISFVESYEREVDPELKKLGFNRVVVHHVKEDSKYIQKNRAVRYEGKVSKGIVIQDAIKQMRAEHNPEIIIFLDGSGKIPVNSILGIIEILRDNPECVAVLAKREGNKGISDERWEIEKFELFIIEDYFGKRLPDGQCGCWGFRNHKDVECSINLTADGYEIELDLLIEILTKKLNFGFLPIKIIIEEGERTPTGFTDEHHKQKIKFLANRLKFGKWKIEAWLNYFDGLNGNNIPDEYKKMIEEMEF